MKTKMKGDFKMKTFFGFTTGLLGGLIAGIAVSAYVGFISEEYRCFLEEGSKEFEQI
jgi:hypothetical protein